MIDPTTNQAIKVEDYEARTEALSLRRSIDTELNSRAVKEQNDAAAQKVVYARPVANSEFSDYDAFMHTMCGDPDDWDKLLVNETIANQKCIGCGYVLSELPDGN